MLNRTCSEQRFVFDCEKSDLCFVKDTDDQRQKTITFCLCPTKGGSSQEEISNAAILQESKKIVTKADTTDT